MTYSWQRDADHVPRAPEVSEDLRARLERIADALIPAAEGMPAASEVGVGREQLDMVLRSRDDLLRPLERALAGAPADGDVIAWMEELLAGDPLAHHALSLTVLAGYYWSDEVKQRLGYPGQVPVVVSQAFPAYVTEGLLDPVLERGPVYREPPPAP